jgi:hypothetical protein
MTPTTRITRRHLVIAALVALLTAISGAVGAQDAPPYVHVSPDGKSYSIDYAALGNASELSQTEKYQVARALRNGSGYIEGALGSIAGFGGHCDIHKKLHVIPVGASCTLTADPAATKILSGLGGFALTNAICLVIDVEDGEITEPICDAVLEAIVTTTIEPVINQCADAGQTTKLSFELDILPKPKAKGSASCE